MMSLQDTNGSALRGFTVELIKYNVCRAVCRLVRLQMTSLPSAPNRFVPLQSSPLLLPEAAGPRHHQSQEVQRWRGRNGQSFKKRRHLASSPGKRRVGAGASQPRDAGTRSNGGWIEVRCHIASCRCCFGLHVGNVEMTPGWTCCVCTGVRCLHQKTVVRTHLHHHQRPCE